MVVPLAIGFDCMQRPTPARRAADRIITDIGLLR